MLLIWSDSFSDMYEEGAEDTAYLYPWSIVVVYVAGQLLNLVGFPRSAKTTAGDQHESSIRKDIASSSAALPTY